MCGIAGEIRFDESIADAEAVATMMREHARRGPDSCGQLMLAVSASVTSV